MIHGHGFLQKNYTEGHGNKIDHWNNKPRMEVEAQKPFLRMKKHAAASLTKTETLAMVVVFHYP